MMLSPGIPALTTFYVYLTGDCNCACRHCWFVPPPGSQPEGQYQRLKLPVLRRAIEQALPLGLEAVKWTGGEPTLHPDFKALLGLQKEHGLEGVVETNGMLIDSGLAGVMAECGVRRVSVSLDGADALTHDTIRAVDGGYARTLKGIRCLVAAGYAPELILTLQRANSADLPEFFALAEELGAGAVKLNVLQPLLRGSELASQGGALNVSELLGLQRQLEDSWSQQFGLPIQIDLPMAFRSLSSILSGVQDGVCNILHVLGILPGGAYALCGVGQHVPQLAMAEVMSRPLAEVWADSAVLRQIRQGLPQMLQGICRECLMKGACLGSCIAANYHLSRELTAPYWFCQQAADAGLFPAARRQPQVV